MDPEMVFLEDPVSARNLRLVRVAGELLPIKLARLDRVWRDRSDDEEFGPLFYLTKESSFTKTGERAEGLEEYFTFAKDSWRYVANAEVLKLAVAIEITPTLFALYRLKHLVH